MPDLFTLIGQFGLPIVLTILFVFKGNEREKRMADRIDKIEDYVRVEFTGIVERTTSVISENSRVMRDLETWLENSSDSRVSHDIHQVDPPHITQRKSGPQRKPPRADGGPE